MSKMKRQHPIVIITGFLDELKSLLVPIALSFIVQLSTREAFGLSRGYIIFMSILLLFMIVYGLFRWIFFKYMYSDQALIIKQGIFIKKNRTIKKERIQSINTEAGILLRLFNLVTLNIETAASAQEPEFNIKALSKAQAIDITNTLKGDALPNDEPLKEKDETVTLNVKQLLLAGVTSGSVGIIFGFLGVIVSQGFVFLPEQAIDWIIDSLIASSFVVILTVGSIVFIVAWVISIVRFIIRFAFFTLHKDDERLYISRGLIVQKTFSIKLERIQALIIQEGILRQPFNLATIEAEIAGGSKYEDSFRISLMPVIHKTWIQSFIQTYTPDYAIDKTFNKLPKRALRRYLIRSNAVLLFVIPLLSISLYFLWALMFVFPLSVIGYFRFKDGGYYVHHNMMILRTRLLNRKTFYALKPHVQSMGLNRTIFQKFRKLFTVELNVLSAAGKSTFNLKDLDTNDFSLFYTWFKR